MLAKGEQAMERYLALTVPGGNGQQQGTSGLI